MVEGNGPERHLRGRDRTITSESAVQAQNRLQKWLSEKKNLDINQHLKVYLMFI